MFYCEKCRIERQWPESIRGPTSLGPCECCGKTQVCHDAPSSWLPMPRFKKKPGQLPLPMKEKK